MATISGRKTKSGFNYSIRFFIGSDRKTLSLGSLYTESQRNKIVFFVEEMARTIENGGTPSRSLQGFLEDAPPDLRKRLERAGLIEPSKEVSNYELWDLYTGEQGDRKESTMKTYVTAQKRFLSFFDPEGNPRDITDADGRKFKVWLKSRGYAEASIAGTFQRSKSVFNWAIENGYMDTDPFSKIPRGSFINKDREFFVPMTYYHRLLDACPDQTWKTIISLCRIGGLRNPSETLLLKWSDVNWEQNALLVHSPKTEHHKDKATRVIPLYPLLRIELEKQFEEAIPETEGGSPFVIDKWRDTSANMRTHLKRIIFRAGLDDWPRLFHNLRGSRSNELFSKYPAHIASYWMGQSERIAFKHYLHVTDAQFKEALREYSEDNTESTTQARERIFN